MEITLEFCRKRISEQMKYIGDYNKCNNKYFRCEVLFSAQYILGYWQQKEVELLKNQKR